MVFGLLREKATQDMKVSAVLLQAHLQQLNFFLGPVLRLLLELGVHGVTAGVARNRFGLAQRLLLLGLLQ